MDDYNEMDDMIQSAEANLRMQSAEAIAKARQSARYKALEAQQKIAENWNQAIAQTFGSQAEYDKWASENPEQFQELLFNGMASFVRTVHTQARDSQGKFKGTKGKERMQKIAEQRAAGKLSSNDALDKIVRGVLFGK